MNVPIIFGRVNFSLRKKNPIRIANKIDVSRIAITTAIGAFEKAHITIAYAAREAPPPTQNIPLASLSKFGRIRGETIRAYSKKIKPFMMDNQQ